MHKPRYRRAGGGWFGSGRYGRFNMCVMAGIFLLLGSFCLLQVRLAEDGKGSSFSAKNNRTAYSLDAMEREKMRLLREGEERDMDLEREYKIMLAEEGEGGVTDGETSFDDELETESRLNESQKEKDEEDGGERFEELDAEMDMEDEDVDEFESFQGDVGEWLNEVDEFSGKEGDTDEGTQKETSDKYNTKASAERLHFEAGEGDTKEKLEYKRGLEETKSPVAYRQKILKTRSSGDKGREQQPKEVVNIKPRDEEDRHMTKEDDANDQTTQISNNLGKLATVSKDKPEPTWIQSLPQRRKKTEAEDGGSIALFKTDLVSKIKSGSNVYLRGGRSDGSVGDNMPGPRKVELVDSGKDGLRMHKLQTNGDTRRWGHFPGLHPKLSFTGFMEEFLLNEKCGVRVFMAWTTPPWSFTIRHQRVLESLLYFHPDACVVVFSESIELTFFQSFVDEGYRVAVAMPQLQELLEDTPSGVFADIYLKWRKVNLFYLHYTELLRLAALYKYGGIYLDMDMIVLKPLIGLQNTIGTEILPDGRIRPNGAAMFFERFSLFLNACLVEYTATYDEKLVEWNGAALLDRVVNRQQYHGHGASRKISSGYSVEEPSAFFPLRSADIFRYFEAPENETGRVEDDLLYKRILDGSYTVHLWNALTSHLVPDPGSLVHRLMERKCIRCTDIL